MCSTVAPTDRGGEGNIPGNSLGHGFTSLSTLAMFRVPPVLRRALSRVLPAVENERIFVLARAPSQERALAMRDKNYIGALSGVWGLRLYSFYRVAIARSRDGARARRIFSFFRFCPCLYNVALQRAIRRRGPSINSKLRTYRLCVTRPLTKPTPHCISPTRGAS